MSESVKNTQFLELKLTVFSPESKDTNSIQLKNSKREKKQILILGELQPENDYA